VHQFGGQEAFVSQEDYVRDGEPPTGLEDPVSLPENLLLLGGEVYDAVGDHHVHVLVGQRNLLDLPLKKLHVLYPGLLLVLAGQGQHLVGHVQSVSLTSWRDTPGGEQHIYTATASEV